MADMADLMSVHEHTDPDAQATVTDFIDYTEYLPSDLERALSLIGKLDQTYDATTSKLHQLLKGYCELPRGDDKQASVLEAEDLRARISNKLDLALHVREATFVEASRLHDDMLRHRARLSSIHTKLLALPKPPSRDPTPQPVSSPILNKRDLNDGQRLKLKVEGARMPLKKLGSHPTPRVIVPGEVLPPRNPDSPTASMYDEFTSDDSSEEDDIPSRLKKSFKAPKPLKAPKLKIPKIPRIPKEKKERPPRPPRPHGVMGTNVHSSVAGISTSNALMLLDPPPPDAKLGSEHSPWMRLTEWEMAKLRKRMKKNAIWAPSDTMIRRELADSGRGPEAYYNAKQTAEENGEEFIDCDDLANRDKNRPLAPGEIPLDAKSKTFNRGMSLNVQKKRKRDLEAMLAKEEAAKANVSLSSLGTKMLTLFTKPSSTDPGDIGDKIVLKSKKRKRGIDDEGSPTDEAANAQLHSEIILASKPSRKADKKSIPMNETNTAIVTTTTTVPLAAPAASPVIAETPTSQSLSPNSTRKGKIMTMIKQDIQAASKPGSRRASVGPEVTTQHRPRKSTTPAPQPVAGSRLRNRRQAPGIVTNDEDGGAAVSIGKRKNAPRKRGVAGVRRDTAATAVAKPDENSLITDEEVVDPNEETYCVCGGVSFGVMIMCEYPDCEKEWFHLECVGLKEPPGRRTKWWCPDCRVKLGLDA